MNFLCYEVEKDAKDSLLTTAGKAFADPTSSEALIISACRIEPITNAITPRLWNPLSPAGGTFRAAIGQVTQAVIAGTFTLTYGANTTAALAFDSTAQQIETALNGLASVISAGLLDVTFGEDEAFIITFRSVGSRTEIVADATNLAPENSIGEVGTLLNGSASVAEVQYLRFVQEPAALADLTEAAPGPDGTAVTLVTGGTGVNAKYRVTLYTVEMDGSVLNTPYDGKWSITLGGVESGLISWDATGDESPRTNSDAMTIIEAMSSIGAGNATVTRESPGVYLIGFQGDHAGENMGTMTVDCDALKVVPYMTGTLDLSNPAVLLLFNGQATAAAIFVIEYTPSGGIRREVCRRDVTLLQAVIADGSLTPAPRISFYTKTETDATIAAAISGLDISDISGLGTMAGQDANAVNITGGSFVAVAISGGTMTGTSLDSVTFTSVGGFNDLTITGVVGIDVMSQLNAAQISLGADAVFIVATSKVFTVSNNIELAGTDGVVINLGAVNGTLAAGAFAAFANPTGTIGLTVVNGAATTVMRSDGAPALSQAIVPTWTGAHTFSAAVTFNAAFTCSPASGAVTFNPTAQGSINNMSLGQSTPLPVGATTLSTTGLASLLGGLKFTYAQKTSTYPFAATDFAIEATSGTFTLTLPTAAGRIGQPYLAVNSGAGTITLSTTGGQTINGLSTLTLLQGAAFQVQSNGSNWVIIGAYGAASAGSFTALTASGAVTFTSGTASVSTVTGAVIVTGGVGVSGAINAGGAIQSGAGMLSVGDFQTTGGNVIVGAAGKGIQIKGGSSGRLGTQALTGGTATVTCTNITTNTRIFLQRVVAGGTLGAGGYGYTISAGASFTINSVDLAGVLSVLDTSTVSYLLVEQG